VPLDFGLKPQAGTSAAAPVVPSARAETYNKWIA
jgi:hypothetical protein